MITIGTDISDLHRTITRPDAETPPAGRLRILVAEHDPGDAGMILDELRRSGLEFSGKVIATRDRFLRSLRTFSPDVIVADHSLPGFSAIEALRLLKRLNREIPFILVTGSRSEEAAMECIREGADDYILKQSFVRLPSAITNALAKKEIESRKRAAEEQLSTSKEQLRALSAHLQFIREEERGLIAREIHDELGQTLTAIRMDIAWLQGLASGKRPPDLRTMVEQLGVISRSVESTIRTVRRIATELRPKILDDLGLIPALEWQMEEFQKRTGLRCRFRSTMRELALDRERSTACFRIAQESLTNVLRHSGATEVTVGLRLLGGALTLEISDNGRGITDDELTNMNSLGLLGMKERAFLLGGSVVVGRGERGGTTVRVELPV